MDREDNNENQVVNLVSEADINSFVEGLPISSLAADTVIVLLF